MQMPERGKTNGVVVILSGGLDSATAAMMACMGAVRNGGDVIPVAAVAFDYGQRHLKELDSASLIAQHLDIPFYKFRLPRVIPSHLTEPGTSLEMKLSDYEGPELPPSWHPHRNAAMIVAAAQLASFMKVSNILGGWHQEDVAYPDCSEEFLYTMAQMLRVSGADPSFRILSPLIYLTKLQIVEAAIQYKVPIELTWSCYVGGDVQCGKCGTCKQRKLAFAQAEYTDPVPYADATVYDD